jgi:hypothetical protein
MRKTIFTLFTALYAVFLLSSCQKELSDVVPSDDPNVLKRRLMGNWTFLMLDVKSTVSYSERSGGNTIKAVYSTDFLTKNNTGILVIDSFNLHLNDLGYSIDTVSKITGYLNGFPVLTEEEELIFEAPAFSTTSRYELIGADSIHFPDADFIQLPQELMLPPVTGLKYKIEGDRLKFNTSLHASATDNSSGTNAEISSDAVVVITFQKQ